MLAEREMRSASVVILKVCRQHSAQVIVPCSGARSSDFKRAAVDYAVEKGWIIVEEGCSVRVADEGCSLVRRGML